jgi:two-component system, response regulator PdtaR
MSSPRLRILVVDDHAIIAAGLAAFLAEIGHEVIEIAGTANEAVIAAERHRPDLVFMDIGLEGTADGIEAAQKIRSSLGIRSIFFTGHSNAETRQRAAATDPLAFVDKTASQADLARILQQVAARERF